MAVPGFGWQETSFDLDRASEIRVFMRSVSAQKHGAHGFAYAFLILSPSRFHFAFGSERN